MSGIAPVVEADARGYVPTDAKLRTNVPNLWALGDMNRRGAFTHTSYHDHEIVLAELDGREDLASGHGDRRPHDRLRLGHRLRHDVDRSCRLDPGELGPCQ